MQALKRSLKGLNTGVQLEPFGLLILIDTVSTKGLRRHTDRFLILAEAAELTQCGCVYIVLTNAVAPVLRTNHDSINRSATKPNVGEYRGTCVTENRSGGRP